MTIKDARLKANLSQSEAAKLLEIPFNTWNQWERELRSPPPWAERLIVNELLRIAENKKGTRN